MNVFTITARTSRVDNDDYRLVNELAHEAGTSPEEWKNKVQLYFELICDKQNIPETKFEFK